MRAFLSNIMSTHLVPVSINTLSIKWGIQRSIFDRLTGIDSTDLLQEEVDALWAEVAIKFAEELSAPKIIKTHAAYFPEDGNPFLIKQASRCAVYLVRNPLDVCSSFAHHLAYSIDETIAVMRNNAYHLCQSDSGCRRELGERVSGWSANAHSWFSNQDYPVLILRYEDLLANPGQWFRKTVDFLEISAKQFDIERAITFSAFKCLQAQEQKEGFCEKSRKSASFFRKGEVGDWRNKLSQRQAQQIVREHGASMELLGYSTNL